MNESVKTRERKKLWEIFFEKTLRDYNGESENEEIPLIRQFPSHVFTEPQRALVKYIEITLRSNLKQLILQREKTKAFLDKQAYLKANTELETELSRVLTCASENDLDTYVILIVQDRPELIHYIEKVKRSQMKKFLKNRADAVHANSAECHKWHSKFLEEWEKLNVCINEEELILYAISVLRRFPGAPT